MNTERELDQIIEGWLEDRPGGPRKSALSATLERVHEHEQRRRRWPWWRLGASLPGRSSDPASMKRDRVLAGASIVAAIAVLATTASLLVPALPIDDVLPAAFRSHAYVVALDGSGHHSSINAALEAASDGDTIMIRPGRYAEALVITKSVTLEGDGRRGDVVLEAVVDTTMAEDGRTEERWVHGPELRGTQATLRNLTIVGAETSDGVVLDVGLIVTGGAPTLDSIAIVHPGLPDHEMGTSLQASEGSDVVVRESLLDGDVWLIGGSPSLIKNTVGLRIRLECAEVAASLGASACADDDRPIIRDNTVRGISVGIGTSPVVEENTIEGPSPDSLDWGSGMRNPGIIVWGGAADTGMTPTIRRNFASGHDVGIQIFGEAAAIVEENTLVDNEAGILVDGGDPILRGNIILGSVTGLVIDGAAEPEVIGNRIEDNVLGISLARFARPHLSDNHLCGNQTDVEALAGEPPSLVGKEICET